MTAAKINTSGLTVPNALHANSADTAGSATNSTNAQHASSADTAGDATNAHIAAVSDAIRSVTYVKGNVVSIAANGGSGFAESSASDATCPPGTAVIGTAASAENPGTEISRLIVYSDAGSSTPTNVRANFDNFTNFASSTNYAIAICSAVNTVSNPAPLTRSHAARR